MSPVTGTPLADPSADHERHEDQHDHEHVDDTRVRAARRRRSRPWVAWLALLLLAAVAVAEFGLVMAGQRETWRFTPVYDPPVLAGQQAMPWCTGGFYARHGTQVVLLVAAHCGSPGQPVTQRDGVTPLGVLGPAALLPACPHAGKVCLASDMMTVELDAAAIPWGHLNEVDLGAGGYRLIAPGTAPLACADIAVGANAELDGRGHYRSGRVLEKGENLNAVDPNYFPCIVAAQIHVQTGDSGGAVLVDGRPAGITSRVFDGYVGFTPLAEGLEAIGLELCTDPDCGLVRPR